jgi:cell division septation protein DedD
MKLDSKIMNVNGKSTEVDPGRDTAPITIDGRTMIPARALTEAMGGEVGWNEAARQVTLSANGITLVMTLDKKDYRRNGANMTMDVAPMVRNDRTLIPLRFAGEALGCTVDWFAETREILVTFTRETTTPVQLTPAPVAPTPTTAPEQPTPQPHTPITPTPTPQPHTPITPTLTPQPTPTPVPSQPTPKPQPETTPSGSIDSKLLGDWYQERTTYDSVYDTPWTRWYLTF